MRRGERRPGAIRWYGTGHHLSVEFILGQGILDWGIGRGIVKTAGHAAHEWGIPIWPSLDVRAARLKQLNRDCQFKSEWGGSAAPTALVADGEGPGRN